MYDLIVVRFRGTGRAAEVLERARELADELRIDLSDAVAVHRTEEGVLHMDRSVLPTREQGVGQGAVVGGTIAGLITALFTGGLGAVPALTTLAAGVAAGGALGGVAGGGAADSEKHLLGISGTFVRQVGGLLHPRDSAVFVLVRTSDPEAVIEHFRGYGGSILRTSLPAVEAERLQAGLRGDGSGVP